MNTPGKFVIDMKKIQERAREHIKQGAITTTYELDVNTSLKLLDEALATEIMCTLRYRSHYFNADGIHAESVKAEFLEHANEEQVHADRICERIKQLGGSPDLNPATLVTRSHADYDKGGSLIDMIEEDLIAERVAIDTYREMVQYFGVKDSTSRRLFEEILAQEEEHADDLAGLLMSIDPRKKTDSTTAA